MNIFFAFGEFKISLIEGFLSNGRDILLSLSAGNGRSLMTGGFSYSVFMTGDGAGGASVTVVFDVYSLKPPKSAWKKEFILGSGPGAGFFASLVGTLS